MHTHFNTQSWYSVDYTFAFVASVVNILFVRHSRNEGETKKKGLVGSGRFVANDHNFIYLSMTNDYGFNSNSFRMLSVKV